MMRLAVIDGGGLAEEYAVAVSRIKGLSVQAIVQEEEGAADALRGRLGATLSAGSLGELLEDQPSEFDAVAVHAETSRRCELACQAASAGKHVLVDSPLAGSLEEAQRMIDACRSAGVQLLVATPLRYMPYQRAIRDALDQGKLGATGLVRLHHWRPLDDLPRNSEKLTDAGVELITGEVDLACWLFDEAPELIHCRPLVHDEPDRGLLLHLGFPCGGMALIDAGRVLPVSSDPYYSLTLIGSSGAAYADDHHNTNLLFGEGTRGLRVGQGPSFWVAQLQEFVTLCQGVTPCSSAEQCLRAMHVAQVAIDACAVGAVAKRSGDGYELQSPTSPRPSAASRADAGAAAAGHPRIAPSSGQQVASGSPFRVAVLSVVKHDYVAKGILSHARFEPAVVADDPDQPEWVHARNQQFADEFSIPYVRDVERALAQYRPDVAVVSSAAERHCNLSIRAAEAGLHVVQDKPMSTDLSECDRLVQAIQRHRVRFLMWNRSLLPALLHTYQVVQRGDIGSLRAIHVDFYFAKDAGPPIGSRSPGEPPLDWLELLKAAHATGADGGVGHDPMGELEVEGIYPLAYIHMLCGAPVQRVLARTKAHFHQLHADNGVDDLATVTLQMEGGLLGTLCIGRIGNASHPDIGEIKLHLIGSKGGLVVSEARPEVAVYYRGQPDSEYPHVRVANESDWLLADHFARAIDSQTETLLNAHLGRAICACVHAAIASGRTGQVTEVPQY